MDPAGKSRNPVADELVAYFLTSDADQGLSSSWGPLADMALGGFAGTPDPERRVTDARFGLGPGRRTPVLRARRIRSALLSLEPRHQRTLWAAHGGEPWPDIVDKGSGRGMASKLQGHLGDLLAVALLTQTARAAAPGDEGRWLVLQVIDAQPLSMKAERKMAKGDIAAHERKVVAATHLLERVAAEAADLLASAESAYRDARGWAEDRRPRRGRIVAGPPVPFVLEAAS